MLLLFHNLQPGFNENSNKKVTSKLFSKTKKSYLVNELNTKSYNIDDLKIIGITGAFGKSSVAVLIHRYLQSIGKKSVLYSSAYVDSPAGWLSRHIGYEPGAITEDFVANVLNECKLYEAEYLIFECWDGAISRGAFDNINFDLKVLNSFVSNYGADTYTEKDQYFNIKLKFMATNNCPVLMNMRIGSNEDIYKRRAFIDAINTKKLYYSIFSEKPSNFDDVELDYYFEPIDLLGNNKLKGVYQTLDYSLYNLKSPNKDAKIYKSPLIGFNIDNSLCAYAIADFFGELDQEAWDEFIGSEDLYIAGRTEKINWKDRTIIIVPDRLNACVQVNELRNFANTYYENGIVYYCQGEKLEAPRKINKIISIISPTRGAVSTTKEYEDYKKYYKLNNIQDTAINLDNALSDVSANIFNKYIDFAVLNVIDLGDGDYDKIIEAMKTKLTIPCDSSKK